MKAFLAQLEEFDRTLLHAAILVLGCLGVVIWDQEIQWRMREDYRFGYLVPVFFLYVLHVRWGQIRAILLKRKLSAKPPPSPVAPVWDRAAAVVLFTALFFFALGAAMRAINGPNIMATYLNTGGFVGIALTGLWFFSEKNAGGRVLGLKKRIRFIRLFTFPVLVWLISGPMLYLLDTSVRTYLLVRVGIIVANVLQGLGMDVTACQGIITLPRILPDGSNDIVGVSDACSGVRSLTACIFMGAFLSTEFVQGGIRKLLLLGLSLGFAIVLNLIRTTFLTMWAFKNGAKTLEYDLWLNPANSPDYSLGNVHDIAGYAAMGLTFLLLLASLPLVNLRLRKPVAPSTQ
jgi:exosortase/archaeosortase family protein